MDLEQPSALPAISILLVDDHPAVRKGLTLLLAPEGIAVCAEAGGRNEALRCVEECRPDLALVDLSLGGEDGLILVVDLRARAVPSLVYSMHEDARHVEGAFAAGALGYVTKREIDRVLVQAIREVAARHRFVSPIAAVALSERISGPVENNAGRALSKQERQVYNLLGQGEGTIEIAAALHISTRTVESYYTRIMDKLGLAGMHDLRRHAINSLRSHTQ
jgi:DNA-binding NarL/FixJ family response regulator